MRVQTLFTNIIFQCHKQINGKTISWILIREDTGEKFIWSDKTFKETIKLWIKL